MCKYNYIYVYVVNSLIIIHNQWCCLSKAKALIETSTSHWDLDRHHPLML